MSENRTNPLSEWDNGGYHAAPMQPWQAAPAQPPAPPKPRRRFRLFTRKVG